MLQDRLASLDVRLVDEHLPIEPARPHQRGVEHLRPVRRGHDDDALPRVEAVHLREQLVQRLLALLVPAHRRLLADLAERVELVDEDDARRLGFSLPEQIADARGADADEHLDELGAAQAEEGHLRLAGDRAREQSFPGPRRADEQHALRDASAERRVLARVLQEVDDLAQFIRRLFDAGDVREAHLDVVVGVDLGAAARERHDAALGAAHAAEEERPQRDDEHDRQDPAQDLGDPPVLALAAKLDALRFELLDELRIAHDRRVERHVGALGVAVLAADDLGAERDRRRLALGDVGLELRVLDRAALSHRRRDEVDDEQEAEQGRRGPERRELAPRSAGFAAFSGQGTA